MALAECDSYVIGFKGAGGQFDRIAFDRYAESYNLCGKVFRHEQIHGALDFIKRIDRPYMLYGFSAGAAAVAYVARVAKRKPQYILTIGALSSTRLDFHHDDINYDNFFDASGRRNPAPGIHVAGVSHNLMQQYVTDFFNPKQLTPK
jgi:hypothetical protein